MSVNAPQPIKTQIIYPVFAGAIMLLLGMFIGTIKDNGLELAVDELNATLVVMNLNNSTRFVTVERDIEQIHTYQGINYATLNDHEDKINHIENKMAVFESELEHCN